MDKSFSLIENYIYMYHTDTFIILPVFPESVSDNSNITFAQSTPIARSAPIYSYTGSGPRTVGFDLKLHRDYMQVVNAGVSNIIPQPGDDYIDTLVKQLQACAVPNYESASKMVDPPLVAVRIGNDVFIKGVVSGSPRISYSGALIVDSQNRDGPPRYSEISISMQIEEITPFSARDVMRDGSFRGFTSTIENRLYGREVVM